MSFYIAKIFWLILNPFNILVLLSAISLIFFNSRLKFIKNLSIFFLIFFFIISCVLPTGSILVNILERQFHKNIDINNLEDVDGILILGGSTDPDLSKIYNQIIFKSSAERLIEAKRMIKKFPDAKVIFAGGSSKILNNNNQESVDAKNYFNDNNINTDKFIFENSSRNTYENIIMSEKISKRTQKEKWIIISSAYHLQRSINVAKKIGWELIPYATDFQVPKKINFNISLNFFSNLSLLQLASHEWIGLLYYYLTGKTDKLI